LYLYVYLFLRKEQGEKGNTQKCYYVGLSDDRIKCSKLDRRKRHNGEQNLKLINSVSVWLNYKRALRDNLLVLIINGSKAHFLGVGGFFFSFLISHTVGRTLWTGNQSDTMPLPVLSTTQRE
jgi:hypothetical protein